MKIEQGVVLLFPDHYLFFPVKSASDANNPAQYDFISLVFPK